MSSPLDKPVLSLVAIVSSAFDILRKNPLLYLSITFLLLGLPRLASLIDPFLYWPLDMLVWPLCMYALVVSALNRAESYTQVINLMRPMFWPRFLHILLISIVFDLAYSIRPLNLDCGTLDWMFFCLISMISIGFFAPINALVVEENKRFAVWIHAFRLTKNYQLKLAVLGLGLALMTILIWLLFYEARYYSLVTLRLPPQISSLMYIALFTPLIAMSTAIFVTTYEQLRKIRGRNDNIRWVFE